MMKSNYLRLPRSARVVSATRRAARQRLPSRASDYLPELRVSIGKAFARYLRKPTCIAIGEPLVRAIVGLPPRSGLRSKHGAGYAARYYSALRLLAGLGNPCDPVVAPLRVVETPPFVEARTTPEACRSCVYLESCYGGCAGRRRIQNALDQPDFYCPLSAEKPKAGNSHGSGRELPKGESACTTIVIARD